MKRIIWIIIMVVSVNKSYSQNHSNHSNTIKHQIDITDNEDYFPTILGSDWILVTKSKQGDPYFIKSDCIKTEFANIINVWIKEFNKTFTYNGRIYRYAMCKTLMSFNCVDRQIQTQSTVAYDYKGNLIMSQEYENYENKYENVVPESIGEDLLKKVIERYYQQ